jgi:hypothetical protein
MQHSLLLLQTKNVFPAPANPMMVDLVQLFNAFNEALFTVCIHGGATLRRSQLLAPKPTETYKRTLKVDTFGVVVILGPVLW